MKQETNPVVLYQLRSLPAQARLSGNESLQQVVFGNNVFAWAFEGQGTAHYKRAHYATAAMWHSATAVLYQALLTQTGEGRWQNDLASTYMGRGNVFKAQGKFREAVVDHDQAIQLQESLKARLTSQQQARLPEWQNNLANAYGSRGNALSDQGKLSEAVADYHQAIRLQKSLKVHLANQQQAWTPEWQNNLANAYSNRGLVLSNQGKLSEALADYNQAIQLRKSIRKQLVSQQHAWTPEWQNDWAKAYVNRGNLLSNQGKFREAVLDYDQAIQLQKSLKDQLVSQQQTWPPEWQNDLARVYMNRGVGLLTQGKFVEALADYRQAIQLQKSLKDQLANQQQVWPPAWQNDLARAYVNRGNAWYAQDKLIEALADYDQAIQLQKSLKDQLASQQQAWPPAWQNDLAKAYVNRGNAWLDQSELGKALTDYGQAIQLQESLRKQLASQQQVWPPDWQNDLAMAYMNRGTEWLDQGKISEAVADYHQAIQLLTPLLFEQKFIPVIPGLTKAYRNLVLASRHPALPDDLKAINLSQQARDFLTQLAAFVDVSALPEMWLKEIKKLERVLDNNPQPKQVIKKINYPWWQKLLLAPIWNPALLNFQRKLAQHVEIEDLPEALRTKQAIAQLQHLKSTPPEPVNNWLFYGLMPLWLPLLIFFFIPIGLGKAIWMFRKNINWQKVGLFVFIIALMIWLIVFV
ncbi:tetratricopeptide repeat protein [Thioflexithrix psekupsensis]|uniref:Tetratricopeptide repeat protein n=1 Tax=Thioflexithrix psekupsensis TaxID=1570016 RepID=A0A251X799_9GAMM|nr:tetratricopeptide repeat protein [Thioflexithrix psekupsensis]OUD13059.1 hypothetical protein TPSD3_10425 [Thioflexithrix psekupsensis]